MTGVDKQSRWVIDARVVAVTRWDEMQLSGPVKVNRRRLCPLNGPGVHVALDVRRSSWRRSRGSLLSGPYVSLASWDSPSPSGGILVGFTSSQDVVTVNRYRVEAKSRFDVPASRTQTI